MKNSSNFSKLVDANKVWAIGSLHSSLESFQSIKNYILSNFSLPHPPKKSELLPFLVNDKKNKDGKISFSLLNQIGECSIDHLFSADEL